VTGEVRLRPEAEQDLVEAATWYEGNQPGLGRQFLDEANETLASIGEQPLAYTVVYRSLRRALLKRFPFAVFFLTNDQDVVVVAILHGSRHPRFWKKRI
jgi:plasmid stabilization system protein ParE